MCPQPHLKLRQNPDFTAPIRCMTGLVLGDHTLDKFGPNNPARSERAGGVVEHFPQGRMCLNPNADWKSKAMLVLSDDLFRQEVLQRLLEKSSVSAYL
jgi:hypothetical protein